jgi:ubiquinone/menaquinone biosynthesis C-methylase UbiE
VVAVRVRCASQAERHYWLAVCAPAPSYYTGGLFTKSQRFYDLVYSWKDYPAEAERLHVVVQGRKRSSGNRLLDVACGTGKHLELLRDRYDVEGVDIDPGMLAIASERLPGVELHRGDFRNFDLRRRYDVVMCLFSSVAYASDVGELRQAVATMARHLEPGGVLVVEPFYTPEQFTPGRVDLRCAEESDLKVARMARADVRDGRALFEFHYLVGQPGEVEYLVEQHVVSLFRHEDYLEAFRDAGLDVEHDSEGLMGRGLYFGARSG